MPARVVVVHDEPGFVGELVAALHLAGHQVADFTDPLAAWDALAAARLTEVLITGVQFPAGKSNGLALALMARVKRPGIQVIFTARPQFARECEDAGMFLPLPVSVPHVAKTVELLLQQVTNSHAKAAGASLNLSGEGNGQLPIEPSLGRATRRHPLRDGPLGGERTTGSGAVLRGESSTGNREVGEIQRLGRGGHSDLPITV
jgi:DNA-binding NtrC family response regulator